MNKFFHKTQLLMVEINTPAKQQQKREDGANSIDKIEKLFYYINRREMDRF